MFQYLATEDGIETGIRHGNGGDVTDQINVGGIPAIGLQTFIRHPRPLVLTKILRHIVQMTAVLTVFKLASSGIKQTCTFARHSKFA